MIGESTIISFSGMVIVLTSCSIKIVNFNLMVKIYTNMNIPNCLSF